MEQTNKVKELSSKIKTHEDAIRKIQVEIDEALGYTRKTDRRMRTVDVRLARDLIGAGKSKTYVAAFLGISRVTLYRALDDAWRLRHNEKCNFNMKKYSKRR